MEFVDQVFDIFKESLEEGEKVKISGFGNFVVRQKRPRKGRNPAELLRESRRAPSGSIRSDFWQA